MESIGGYRLVRRLGAGSRSEVWLGTDGSDTAVIKVFREGTARERIDAEIEALGRASSRHLLRLEDLSMGPDGVPCLILQRLSQWNLGRVVGTTKPRLGEAVTILAPLCLAVVELHRVGVSHGRIRGGSVLFDDVGAPVLASFGDATLFGPMPNSATVFSVPPAQLMRRAEVAADLEGLANLCRSMLIPESDLARWLEDPNVRVSSTFAHELAERLFQLAAAEPVRFAMPSWGETSTRIPSRVRGSSGHSTEVEVIGGALSRSGPNKVGACGAVASSISTLMHLPDGMVDTVFEGWHKNVVKRISDALRPVRKSVWIMAGVVTVGVVVATAMLPLGWSDDGSGSGSGAEALALSATPSVVAPVEPAVATGDDPLLAATALLEARNDCFAALSVSCLETVNQQGSAAMESDVAQLRLLQEGGAVHGAQFIGSGMVDDSSVPLQVTVVERLGDSVLLSITVGVEESQDDSLSLLLIKTDEGWRIRDFTPATQSAY